MDESKEVEPEVTPVFVRVQESQAVLRARASELNGLANALGPLGKEATYDDIKKAIGTLAKVASKIPASFVDSEHGGKLIEEVAAFLEKRDQENRERLGADLKAACDERELEMKVLRKDDLVELRINPLAVVIDRKKGRASIQFAKETILEVQAEAHAILDGYDDALRILSGDFDPSTFHDDCFRAWLASRAAGGGKSERVEVVDFLPYLALQRQSAGFRKDPKQSVFRDYTRVQFAWDVLRLREQRMLIHNGLRLNLGVATGTSASKKSRVIFFEDDRGDGEYKLTVFFTKEES
ncbi:MAG: hypothetical protein ACI97A_003694 [Planctomycetota bacterium]